MKENKIKITIFLILILIISGTISIIVFLTSKQENPEEIHETITDNYIFDKIYDFNEYQTVYKNVINYYNQLNGNEENIMNLLFKDYIKDNQITYNNINNFIEKKFDNFGYNITDIEKYSNTYFSIYFVKGNYFLEGLEETLENIEVKHIVILDIINNTYAMFPLFNENGNFEEIIQEYNLDNYNQEITNNNENKILRDIQTDFNETSFYFNSYIRILTNDCETAYNLTSDNTKNIYKTLDSFQNVCTAYKEMYTYPAIKNFNIEYNSNEKIINVQDSYGINYKIFLKNVLEYTVYINLN